MIAIMISSSGASWEFFATQDNKVFMVEQSAIPEGKEQEALGHLMLECRWMFGDDKQVIVLDDNDEWQTITTEDDLSHGYEPYTGEVPVDAGHEESLQ